MIRKRMVKEGTGKGEWVMVEAFPDDGYYDVTLLKEVETKHFKYKPGKEKVEDLTTDFFQGEL